MTSPTTSGKRAQKRAATQQAILEVAGRHLSAHGAAGLSLRAIARDLGMVSSAVYRYVESRDELLTLLIVEAYDSLGDAVDATVDGAAAPHERFRQIGRAARAWAVAHPECFSLLYGSPVPGYHAPGERTSGPGTRVTTRLLEVLADLPPTEREDSRAEVGLAPLAHEVGQLHPGITPSALANGLAAWLLVLGAVRAELFEEFGPAAFGASDEWFELVVDQALGILGP